MATSLAKSSSRAQNPAILPGGRVKTATLAGRKGRRSPYRPERLSLSVLLQSFLWIGDVVRGWRSTRSVSESRNHEVRRVASSNGEEAPWIRAGKTCGAVREDRKLSGSVLAPEDAYRLMTWLSMKTGI